jgi:ornithine cyclodeaminase
MTRAPLVAGALLKPGAHVDAVGAYLPDHREIDDDVVRRAHADAAVFVDDRRAPLTESGDLVIPIRDGAVPSDVVRADLYQLCRGEHPGRTGADQVTLFCNGGGGHLDLMVARHIWRAHGAVGGPRAC